jgi:hypothetical protein
MIFRRLSHQNSRKAIKYFLPFSEPLLCHGRVLVKLYSTRRKSELYEQSQNVYFRLVWTLQVHWFNGCAASDTARGDINIAEMLRGLQRPLAVNNNTKKVAQAVLGAAKAGMFSSRISSLRSFWGLWLIIQWRAPKYKKDIKQPKAIHGLVLAWYLALALGIFSVLSTFRLVD